MNDNKNIDRLFQEKFKDFEKAPDDAVWNRINESLPNKKKKRRVIPLWWQIGGVAAAIALLLTIGISVFNPEENPNLNLPVVNTDKTDNTPEDNNAKTSTKNNQNLRDTIKETTSKIVDSNSEENSSLEISENDSSQNKNAPNLLSTSDKLNEKSEAVATRSNLNEKSKSSEKRRSLSSNTNDDENTKLANQTKTSKTDLQDHKKSTVDKSEQSQLASQTKSKSTIKKSIEYTQTAIVKQTTAKQITTNSTDENGDKTEALKTQNSIIEIPEKDAIDNAIAENNELINEEEKENNPSRWSITPNVAPVYFSSLGKGSALDQQFNDNSKNSDINMSYGIVGRYAVSKKLKIRAGINRVNLNQATSDVFAFTGAQSLVIGEDAQFKNISFNHNEQQVSLMSTITMNRFTTPELFNTKLTGNIDQQFGFIEVPIELEYRLSDQKFGINVIGGFSTFILNENEIYADVNGSTTLIGKANNINNTSFSANFGLGMDYSLSQQWYINLEPTFKYQINTFNNTSGDFKPFFIGVYTGLNYKF